MEFDQGQINKTMFVFLTIFIDKTFFFSKNKTRP